jgi:hypothetical protein
MESVMAQVTHFTAAIKYSIHLELAVHFTTNE